MICVSPSYSMTNPLEEIFHGRCDTEIVGDITLYKYKNGIIVICVPNKIECVYKTEGFIQKGMPVISTKTSVLTFDKKHVVVETCSDETYPYVMIVKAQ